MRKILEELYHGNLSVDERTIRAGSKYARALAEVAKIEEAIYERLPEKDHALLRDYGYCQELCANTTASLMKLVRRRPNRPRACSAWLPISGPSVVRQGWRSHLRSP